MEVLIPLIMSWLVDRGIERGDMSQIYLYGGLLLATAFVSLFSGVMSGRMAAIASAGFARNLRHDMYYSIQDFSFANIDKFSTSSIITRLTTDVNNVQNAFQMILRMAVRAPMTLIFSLIMAMTINARISMVFADGSETTGISTAEVSTAKEDNVCYTLQGIRVAKPTHGIYVRNGKKVLVK